MRLDAKLCVSESAVISIFGSTQKSSELLKKAPSGAALAATKPKHETLVS
jgi:hypothetical protein